MVLDGVLFFCMTGLLHHFFDTLFAFLASLGFGLGRCFRLLFWEEVSVRKSVIQRASLADVGLGLGLGLGCLCLCALALDVITTPGSVVSSAVAVPHFEHAGFGLWVFKTWVCCCFFNLERWISNMLLGLHGASGDYWSICTNGYGA